MTGFDGLLDFAKTPQGQGLLAAVAGGMTGARRGTPWNNAGRAGLAGLAGYSNAVSMQGTQELRDLQTQVLRNTVEKPQKIADIMRGPMPEPSAAPQPMPAFGQGTAPMPTTESQPIQTPKVPGHVRYMETAQRFEQAGYLDEAKQYYDLAEKFRPKLKSQTQLRNGDGKIVTANVFEDGRTEAVDGFAPAEKLTFQNTGGSTVALDPFTGMPVNTIRNTQSPESIASNATSMRGQNMSQSTAMRGQNLTDARSRESNASGKLPTGYRWAANGQLEPIPGGPAMKDKAPTEFQGKSATFGSRAEVADRIITGLTGDFSPVAINSKNSVEGVPLLGGIMGAVTNKFALSSNDQRADQAQRDFVNAVLRQESGAAIAESEFENAKKQYFPQPGDGKEVIKQKEQNRKLAVRGFQNNAGSALQGSAGPQPGGVVDFGSLK